MSRHSTFDEPLAFEQLLHDESFYDAEVESDSDTEQIVIKPEIHIAVPDEFNVSLNDSLTEDTAEHFSVGRNWKYIPSIPDNTEGQKISNTCTLTSKSEHVNTEYDCFHLFINDEIMDLILLHTNNESRSDISSKQSWKPIDRIELEAFFGLLILSGRFKEAKEHRNLWRVDEAMTRPIYAATMARERFTGIYKRLRFDDHVTREERKLTNSFTQLEEVTKIFVENCKTSLNASDAGCLDEQLVMFRGWCPFQVYMSNKFGKYGIKIWTLCDWGTYYCCNMQVHLGWSEDTVDQDHRMVKELTDFWKNSGRIITLTNSVTDFSLAEELIEDNIFVIGTLQKDKPGVPKELMQSSNDQAYFLQHLFTDKLMLLSYIPKPRTRAILLCTAHHKINKFAQDRGYEPEVIKFYDNARNSVNAIDKIMREQTCRRFTPRWTIALFMYYLDIAVYNAFVIWHTKFPMSNLKLSAKRKLFVEELTKQLVSKNIDKRATEFENQKISLSKHIINAIEATGRRVFKIKTTVSAQKRSTCSICVGNRNKYTTRCDSCKHHICNDHATQSRSIICDRCLLQVIPESTSQE